MRREIAKSEYKFYYSRMAHAYFVKIMGVYHYFQTRKAAQAFCDEQEAKLLDA